MDNTTLNTGVGGDTLRTEDRTTFKTPVSLLDVGGVAGEALIGDAGNYMPVEGAAAENAAAAGNPVLVGARYDLTPRTLGDGDVGAIALAADGAVHIDDGGNSITVDAAELTTIAGAVSGTEMQVDVVAALPAGTNAIGKLAANDGVDIGDVTINNASIAVTNAGTFATQEDGAALTALQLIDDIVATLGTSTYTETTTKGAVVGAVRNDTLAALASLDNEIAPLQVNSIGALYTTLHDASNNAIEVVGLAGTNGLGVAVVDASGNQVTSFSEDQISIGTALPGAQNTTMAGVVRDDALTTLADPDGDVNVLRVDSTGGLWVKHSGDVTIADGGNSITVDNAGTFATQAAQSGTWTVQPGNTANTTAWLVNDRPDTTGGLSQSKTVSAASTNATSVKGSAGQVYAVQVFNTNASARYLKLYDKATAPTVGTDTPVKTLLIPGNSNGAGMVLNWDKGLVFSSGIAFALTTGVTDADTGAVAANELVVNLDYK